METELASQLLDLAARYGAAKSLEETTIGRLCASDTRFFSRIRDGGKTFTVRKRDDVVRWFAMNWPDGVEWPAEIDRPTALAPERAS